jgi:hypothetical protein
MPLDLWGYERQLGETISKSSRSLRADELGLNPQAISNEGR